MIKVLMAFGTRPEAIKMCPLVIELKKRENVKVSVCVSGQHREMLHSVMSVFGVSSDYDLDIMSKEQTLFDITTKILESMKKIIDDVAPDLILVHGDTSTAFATSLAAFYKGIPVGHVEAGLRSNDILEPFPEEFNRRAITLLSKYDFAPTTMAEEQLKKEGKENVFLTGNTVIDSFKYTISANYRDPFEDITKDKKTILLTTHRRENVGEPMHSIFSAVRRVAVERQDICFIYPLHPNPVIREIALKYFDGLNGVVVCPPFDVLNFHNILSRCYFAVTDSGGIQEEGVALGKPVLVLRNKTERPEGVLCGGLKLIGTDEEEVYKNIMLLIKNEKTYIQMSNGVNPFGNGNASEIIADIIEKQL